MTFVEQGRQTLFKGARAACRTLINEAVLF